MSKPKPDPLDSGYACGSREAEGQCATCPPWCRGRPAFDATQPHWNTEPSEPHVHEFKLRYVCDCGEHSRGQQSNRRCICMPAIAGISDGPNVDCPEHGDGEPPCAMCNDTGWQGADLCPLHGGEAGPYRD